MGPGGLVARRHHVGMPGKGDVRSRVADPCIEVVDIDGAGFAESDAMHLEAGCFQDIFEHAQRASIRRGHRGAADEIAGNGKGISHAPA